MKTLIDLAFSRSRTVLSTLVLILISGLYAFTVIPKESDPDVNIPIIYVQMDHDGISPEDAERLLIRPMEQELRTIERVKEMRSEGYEGGGVVFLEFEAGFDADAAMNSVRKKVDLAKPELPNETEEPTIHEVNLNLSPVLLVAISGDLPERTLLKLARDLQDAIKGISAVLEVKIAGDRDELVEVLIDPVRVESYGLSLGEAASLAAGSNLLVAAGAQDTGQGRFSVKVPGLYETVRDIAGLPIKMDGDAVVTLGDIGKVRRTFKDPESFARINGSPALVLEISKRVGENVIKTVEAVRQVVAKEQAAWPEPVQNAVEVSFSHDRSEEIHTMISELGNGVVTAILLVMTVVVGVLGLRTAGMVGVAIPGSLLTAILVLGALGMTINTVVLFGLILAVGMLVDGAIVVTECADRKMAEGEPRKQAYATAAKRMAHPIIASTATTLAAFIPLVFWPGMLGEFMKFLPLTLIATLIASLFMALIFVPTIGAYAGKPTSSSPKVVAWGKSTTEDLLSAPGVTGWYVRLLDRALRHPALVLLGALGLLVGALTAYAQFGKGLELFPEIEPQFAKIQIRAQGNLSVWEKFDIVKEVESRIFGMEEFETIYTRAGANWNSEEAADIIGTITLTLTDWRVRRPAEQILAEVRQRTRGFAGIFIDVREQEEGLPIGKPVQVELSARDPSLLEPAVAHILKGFEAIGGLINIEDGRPLPGIDWVIKVDRAQAAKFAVDVGSVGRAVQMATNGFKIGEYRPDDSTDEIDINIRYPVDNRTITQLGQARIGTPQGPVPISSFVERIAKPRVGKVNRVNAKRIMSVKADLVPGVLADAKIKALTAWLAENPLQPGVGHRFKGEDGEKKETGAFLGGAFVVALFVMAIILVTQFNSFYSGFLILTAVAMSTTGVFVGLLVTGQPFGIVMNGLGIIALAGIVVNNNIVLIDTFDRLMETGDSVRDAILRTGAQRLRPVLLTTVTTILGLMPMALGLSINFATREVTIGAPAAQWWTQLATAIVFGLGFATVLTLVVAPSALMFRANMRRLRQKLGRRLSGQSVN